MNTPPPVLETAGLCAKCLHARMVHVAKGGAFVRCARSEADERFPKYPRLPVRSCPGLEPAAPELP